MDSLAWYIWRDWTQYRRRVYKSHVRRYAQYSVTLDIFEFLERYGVQKVIDIIDADIYRFEEWISHLQQVHQFPGGINALFVDIPFVPLPLAIYDTPVQLQAGEYLSVLKFVYGMYFLQDGAPPYLAHSHTYESYIRALPVDAVFLHPHDFYYVGMPLLEFNASIRIRSNDLEVFADLVVPLNIPSDVSICCVFLHPSFPICGFSTRGFRYVLYKL